MRTLSRMVIAAALATTVFAATTDAGAGLHVAATHPAGLAVPAVAAGPAASAGPALSAGAALSAGPAVAADPAAAGGPRPTLRIAAAARPPIIVRHIPFGAKRKRETAAYARRHYGIDGYRLTRPRVIVEHYTVNDSVQATFNTFAPDVPDVELHELPGVCSHYVVGANGQIFELVPVSLMCRHTVGLNYTAIGIEHVGRSDQDILGNPRQLQASLRLTTWLRCRFEISVDNVIGHSESLSSRYHRENVARLRTQTHADWTHADMQIYRGKLRATPC